MTEHGYSQIFSNIAIDQAMGCGLREIWPHASMPVGGAVREGSSQLEQLGLSRILPGGAKG